MTRTLDRDAPATACRLKPAMAWLLLAGLCCAALPGVGVAVAAGAGAFIVDATTEGAATAALREEAVGYENGAGVSKDIPRAVSLYCAAARLGDAESQFALGWIYAYGRGVPRNDAAAAYFFAAAAEQGIEQAPRMLQRVGPPGAEVPACMIERPPAAVKTALGLPAPPALPAQSQPARIAAPKALVALVQKMAPAYQVEPQLALAIMQAESNFDSHALSPKNAMGLMQLLPETAARFNVKDPYDPKQNLRGGLAYLRWLLAYFEGDLTLVTAAYNSGERTVERYRGVPPYAETRGYVRRVVAAMGTPVHAFDSSITRPSAMLRLIPPSGLQQAAR